jgi:hypothetical protein
MMPTPYSSPGFAARLGQLLIPFCLVAPVQAQPRFDDPNRYVPTDVERSQIQEAIDHSEAQFRAFVAEHPNPDPRTLDRIADVAVWHRAAVQALRHGEFFNAKDVAGTLEVLARGLKRLEALRRGEHPWTRATGGSVRGFRSRVDGSFQPYALYLPPEGSRDDRLRLDVILHGRGATLNEARFARTHEGKAYPEGESGLLLHVYGRGNNAYRWAGETDVFEAIEAVKRNYPVDERRIVLRGFSMGGAGAWHLGLHHPSLWAGVEAGAGFAESKQYARLKDLTETQESALRIYDAADYARNAFNVPMAGYGGEEDPQRRASELIQEQLQALGFPMKTEGLVTRGVGINFLRVVGAKTGHKVDPESAQVLMAFRDEWAARGSNPTPDEVRFITYTLKYNQAAWIRVEQMKRHYQPARVTARIVDDTAIVSEAENIALLALDREVAQRARIRDHVFPLRDAVKGRLPLVYYRLEVDGVRMLDYEESRRFQENADRGKRPNLQGPIDDAFTGQFLCVRGTGTPWNPAVQVWANARLDRFEDTWSRYLRGDLPIKNDTDVTPEDIERCHLILFGDPGSNRLLAKLVGDLPVRWSRDEFRLGGQSFPTLEHAPVLISANPSNPLRYVVVNGIHTFEPREFQGTNALLFPRLGDFAVIALENDETRLTGFFNEQWREP